MTNKRNVGVILALLTLGVLIGALLMYQAEKTLNLFGKFGLDLETTSIHTRIRIWQSDMLILDEYHAGVVTDLGDNMTLYKLWGDSDMQYGSLNSSAYTPYISIGNDTGTLASTSVVLPEEWHREVATIDGEAQSQLNFSCTISGADIGNGPETADCIGICFTETDDANDLWGYDTFTQVTGIDSTFTINIDIQVSVAHS